MIYRTLHCRTNCWIFHLNFFLVNYFFCGMTQVVRPQIPYRGSIPGGLHDGKMIEIKGHIPYGADTFSINLLTGLDPYSDRPFHISVRFHGRTVVRNSLEHNIWGPEERHGLFPFHTGRDFTMLILVEPSSYRIAVNSQHCWEFPHRIPYSRVTSIHIEGNLQVERIEFLDKYPARPGVYNPSFPAYPVGTCTPTFPDCSGRPTPHRGINPSFPAFPGGTCIPTYPGSRGPYIPGIQPAVCPPGRVVPPPEQINICPERRNSNLSPVYNPPIPYSYPIYGGLHPGMMIYISGRPSASPYKFTINLQSGTAPYPPPDIAFHFDVRFYNFTVVRNTRTNNVWASEETAVSHFPFQPAVNFDMIIKVEGDKFMIALNGQHYFEFRHRLTPLSRFDTLSIDNDIVVSSIRFA